MTTIDEYDDDVEIRGTCQITGNPIGTDTLPDGEVCHCDVCTIARQFEAALERIAYKDDEIIDLYKQMGESHE